MAKTLVPNKLFVVQYDNKRKDEVTIRTIIPTFVPHQTVSALDISELTPDEQTETVALFSEYSEYHKQAHAAIFNFQTWVEHTKNKTIDVKFRNFQIENLKVID